MTPPSGRDAAGPSPRTPWRARLAHRLAMHWAVDPVVIAPSGPLVSITFDDVPDSACTAGADRLEAHGAKGTFYVSASPIGQPSEHWLNADGDRLAALALRGHEIGCHTYSHAFLPSLAPEALASEFTRNRDRLREIVPGVVMENFAYPFGYASMAAKRALKGTYATSRGIATGVNRGRVDRHFLRANPLIEGRMDSGRIERLMDEAVARNGWLIFYGHDVAARPSLYGCTPDLLEAALAAAALRKIPVVTIAEGLRRAA